MVAKKSINRSHPNRIAALPKGKKHWRWSMKPNLLTLHKRLHRKHGPASKFACADCGKPAHDWSNETGKYTDDIKDYKPRCRSCHVKRDKNWLKNRLTNKV